jgi:hypothetical protein
MENDYFFIENTNYLITLYCNEIENPFYNYRMRLAMIKGIYGVELVSTNSV